MVAAPLRRAPDLAMAVVDRPASMRGAGKSYSHVILRLGRLGTGRYCGPPRVAE